MYRSTAVGALLAALLAACSTTPPPSNGPTIASPQSAPGAGIPSSTSVPTHGSEPVLGRAPLGETERARVVRVTDGDTIVIDRGRGNERLRYIGVDTPESVRPNTPVEFMAKEAAAANAALVEGREVVIERDTSEYDRFDRLLRYVWVEDPSSATGWLFVNLELVARGYAQVVTFPPDVRYADLYREAQRAAREQRLGLWAASSPVPATRPLVGAPRPGCDPAYPRVCIPPPPPDLDCRDIEFRRFQVLPGDPHRLDLDFDGVGCERG